MSLNTESLEGSIVHTICSVTHYVIECLFCAVEINVFPSHQQQSKSVLKKSYFIII